MIKLTYNGKRMISPGQIRREFEKSMHSAFDHHIRAAAPSGVKIKRTAKGYEAVGNADAIQRMVKRLGH